MNATAHALAGLAIVSLYPSAAASAAPFRLLPWCLAALFAILPDATEWLLRNLRRADATLTPDPLLPDAALADAVLHGIAASAAEARRSGRPLRLRIRPLPASRGLLRLRLLPRHAEALVLTMPIATKDAPLPPNPKSIPLPASSTPWPGAIDIAPSEGAVLAFAPAPGRDHPLSIVLETPFRGRGLAHSPLLLLVLPVLLLFVPHLPLAGTAAALGLLTHGLLDLAGDQGLPRRNRLAPGLGLHLWRDASPVANRTVILFAAAGLAFGLVRDTPYILHRSRLFAAILLFLAAALFLGKYGFRNDKTDF